MAIIPHYLDVAPIVYNETEEGPTIAMFPLPFMETLERYKMAVLAKRFPALVAIKSAIPRNWEGWERDFRRSTPGKFAMTTFSPRPCLCCLSAVSLPLRFKAHFHWVLRPTESGGL